jgi:hypothetical protein
VPGGKAPSTLRAIDPDERRAAIIVWLDAWLKAQPCRQQLFVLVAQAQKGGLNFNDAQAWAMKNA